MTDIVIPKWGLTIEDATLVEWLVAVGEEVSEGDTIAEVETDKATSDLESPASGTIAALLVEPGTGVVPGQVVGRIDG